jgi:hypothetical protein
MFMSMQVKELKQLASKGDYDVFGWDEVVEHVCSLPPSDDARAALEEALGLMPSAVRSVPL